MSICMRFTSLGVIPRNEVPGPGEFFLTTRRGKQFNTIHANDAKFFEELNSVIQYEPAEADDPVSLGLFASIGITRWNLKALCFLSRATPSPPGTTRASSMPTRWRRPTSGRGWWWTTMAAEPKPHGQFRRSGGGFRPGSRLWRWGGRCLCKTFHGERLRPSFDGQRVFATFDR